MFLTLRLDAGGLSAVLRDGTEVAGVEAARAFPITAPDGPVALLAPDGREVAWLPDPAALEPDSQAALAGALAGRHFLPRILRVTAVRGRTDPAEIDAETDRGPTTFTLQAADDVRRLPGGRVLLADAHGVRYLIPDADALDAASRRLLGRYVV